jgi:hypothetical protein
MINLLAFRGKVHVGINTLQKNDFYDIFLTTDKPIGTLGNSVFVSFNFLTYLICIVFSVMCSFWPFR